MLGMDVHEVLRLCSAVREALPVLGADPRSAGQLVAYAADAERACRSDPAATRTALAAVKQIRYLLIEGADGPIAAILADSAASIVGDDIGKLFS